MSRVVHWLPLAHHRREQLEHCLLLPLGGQRRLALCARCTGFHTALLVALVLQAWLHLGRVGTADWIIAISGIFPALFDWGLSYLGRRRGSNAMRLATGVVLGIAHGRALWLFIREPRCEVFWVQIGLCAFGVLAFELVRRLRI